MIAETQVIIFRPYGTQPSFRQGQSLNLKTIHIIQTVLKRGDILDLLKCQIDMSWQEEQSQIRLKEQPDQSTLGQP